MSDPSVFNSATLLRAESHSGRSRPCTSLASSSAVRRTAQPSWIAGELIRMAERCAWDKIDGFLGELEQRTETRGAVLMLR